MSVMRYRIRAAIAGLVALAGLVSFFRWAARYDGAMVIPFLVIGGLALCWSYRRTFKERLTQGQSSATALLLAARSPDEVALAESRERRQQFSILELMLAVAGAAVLFRLSGAIGILAVPAFGCGLIAWAFAKRAIDDQEAAKLGCAGAIVGAAIVICGWLWARLANSFFHASAGGRRIADSTASAVLHRWIVEIPALVTILCLALYAIAIIVVAAKRRRLDLVLASIGYVMCLGFCVLAWVVGLEFEVFD